MSLDLLALGLGPPGHEPSLTLQDPCSQLPHSTPNCPLAFSCSMASGHTCGLSSAQNFLSPCPFCKGQMSAPNTGRRLHMALSLGSVCPGGCHHRCPSQRQLMARRLSGPPAQAAPPEVCGSPNSPSLPRWRQAQTCLITLDGVALGNPDSGVAWSSQSPAVSSKAQPRHGQLL